MKLILKKQKALGVAWTSGHRDSWVNCSINGITLDKRLESANNPNPDYKDLELCVARRGMPLECLTNSDRILQFFNGVQEGEMTLIV